MTIGPKVLGALGLGVLSSALWDLIKPMLGSLYNAVLALSSLGIDSIREEMYSITSEAFAREVGIVYISQASSSLMFLSVSLAFAFQALGSLRLLRSSGSTGSIQSPQEMIKSKGFLLAALLFLALGVFTTATSVRAKYAHDFATYMVNLHVIAAPLVTDQQLKELRAEVANIHSRNDYLLQVRKVQAIIKKGGGKVPARDFF